MTITTTAMIIAILIYFVMGMMIVALAGLAVILMVLFGIMFAKLDETTGELRCAGDRLPDVA